MAKGGKKKSKLGLIIGLVLLLLFAAAGAVVGLAFTGKINIPGLTPKKKPIAPLAPNKPADKPKAATPAPKAPQPEENTSTQDEQAEPTTKTVDKAGAVKLAEVWNEMPTDKLVKLVAKWKPNDLAIVLNEMDAEKTAAILGALKPEVASKVSQELKKVASEVPIETQ